MSPVAKMLLSSEQLPESAFTGEKLGYDDTVIASVGWQHRPGQPGSIRDRSSGQQAQDEQPFVWP